MSELTMRSRMGGGSGTGGHVAGGDAMVLH